MRLRAIFYQLNYLKAILLQMIKLIKAIEVFNNSPKRPRNFDINITKYKLKLSRPRTRSAICEL